MPSIELKQLEKIIEKQDIRVVFQPIFDIGNETIHGYEALSRGPKDSALVNPERLFKAAERAGKLSELELICRRKAITAFAELNLPGKLFLNISPSVLLDSRHPNGETIHYLRDFGISTRRVVVEITEKQKVDDFTLKKAANHYRCLGFDIAIDDLGAGHSGLRQWSELMPDIVKIDRYFIENCHMDVVKKEFLKSILSLARATGAQVIAEGIELESELKLLSSLGVHYYQGYLLERPSSNPSKSFPRMIKGLAAPMMANSKLFSIRQFGGNHHSCSDRQTEPA